MVIYVFLLKYTDGIFRQRTNLLTKRWVRRTAPSQLLVLCETICYHRNVKHRQCRDLSGQFYLDKYFL